MLICGRSGTMFVRYDHVCQQQPHTLPKLKRGTVWCSADHTLQSRSSLLILLNAWINRPCRITPSTRSHPPIHITIRGCTVCWGTAPQARRSRVRFPMGVTNFRPHCDAGYDSASNRNEYQRYLLWGKGGRCVRAENLNASTCRMSEKFWQPQPHAACPGL